MLIINVNVICISIKAGDHSAEGNSRLKVQLHRDSSKELVLS